MKIGIEDTKYKSKIISQLIAKNNIKFESCIDIGCGTENE